jgi:transposase InsO family protein
MDGGRAQIVERGVLTAPDEAWDVAVCQAEVIGRLAAGPRVGLAAADAAASELGISRRQVYVLLGRWRAGEGVVSDLLPRRSSGGRGQGRLPAAVEAILREVIEARYLNRQRRSVAAVYREVVRRCRAGGLSAPARKTLERRIKALDPAAAATARKGADGARRLQSASGDPPKIEGLLQHLQIDHTPVDLEVVDERHRLPIGRPYVTAAIDVASRCVVGLVVTLEAPSAPAHVGAWLRLLRTLLDEVSMVDSRAGPSAAAVLHQIWDTAGLPFRWPRTGGSFPAARSALSEVLLGGQACKACWSRQARGLRRVGHGAIIEQESRKRFGRDVSGAAHAREPADRRPRASSRGTAAGLGKRQRGLDELIRHRQRDP